jgi:hypothetical protein
VPSVWDVIAFEVGTLEVDPGQARGALDHRTTRKRLVAVAGDQLRIGF